MQLKLVAMQFATQSGGRQPLGTSLITNGVSLIGMTRVTECISNSWKCGAADTSAFFCSVWGKDPPIDYA